MARRLIATLPLCDVFRLADPLPASFSQLLKVSPLFATDALTRVREALAREKRLLLLGPPGCGKSTVLAQAFQTGARGHALLDPLEEHFKTLDQPLGEEASALATLSSGELERACRLLPGAALVGVTWPMRSQEWEHLISQALLAVLDHTTAASLRQRPELARLKRETYSFTGVAMAPELLYPIHPWTAWLLPRLSARLLDPSRHAWSFFHGQAPGSLGFFLNNSSVLQPDGEVTLYTPDMLASFFEPLPLEGYDSAMELAARLPFGRRMLRLLALHRLLEHPAIPRPGPEFLAYALHLAPAELPRLRESLAELKTVLDVSQLRVTLPPLGGYPAVPPAAVEPFRVFSQIPRPTRWRPADWSSAYQGDRFVRVELIRGSDVRPPYLKRRLEEMEDPWHYRGDLFFAYVVPANPEEHQHILDTLSPRALPPGLVLALPKEPLVLSDWQQLLGYELARQFQYPFCDPQHPQHEEAQRLLKQKQNYNQHVLQHFFQPENLLLFADQKGPQQHTAETFPGFLYECFTRAASSQPELGHPCLSTVVDPPARRRQRRRALNFLLRQPPEFLLMEKGGQAHQILLGGLRRSGLLRVLREETGWLLCGAPDLEWPRGTFQEALRLLEQRTFQDPAGLPLPLLMDELVTGAARLTPALAEVVLATFLWMNQQSVALHKDGQPLRQSTQIVQALHRCRPSHKDVLCDYRLVRKRRPPAVDYFFRRLCQDLSGGLLAPTPERARALLLEWHRRLTPQQVQIGRNRSPFNPAFLDWLQRLEAAPLDEASFVEELPWVFGMPPLGTEEVGPGRLLERLRAARGTIERSVMASRELLHLGLTEIFAEPFHQDLNAEMQWPTLIYRWFAQLPAAAREHLGGEPIHSLLSAFSPESQNREENLDDLLSELGYPRTDLWLVDFSTEILERIRLAKTQMELADLLFIYPVPPGQRAEAAQELLRKVLVRSELDKEDLIQVIERELAHLDGG